jgi:integrase
LLNSYARTCRGWPASRPGRLCLSAKSLKLEVTELSTPRTSHPPELPAVALGLNELMRGCGLRIEEALAVAKEDFIEDGTVLRVAWQASGDGKKREPLKHRKAGEYRDVPVPSWLWEMVRDMPDGPLIPGNGKLFQRYGTTYSRFMNAAQAAGIPDGFTPHSLRHAFASAMLARGVQITELAHFLGHRDINVTHQVYGHLLPSAAKRAVAALDAEFAEWSKS